MYGLMQQHLANQLVEVREKGLFKPERVITTPQDARIRVGDGQPVLNLCANNYLGLAHHPEVVAAARAGLERWGYGLSSVRFICGTQAIHEELEDGMYNYGQLQVTFDDGSVGWYEAGWGPMMSEVAYFVKDVIGPRGSVSIVDKPGEERDKDSSDVDSHTATNCLQVHYQDRDENDEFVKPDEFVDTTDEPDHDGLCLREQQVFARAILEDVDISDHLADAISATRIVLAADESFRTGKTIEL